MRLRSWEGCRLYIIMVMVSLRETETVSDSISKLESYGYDGYQHHLYDVSSNHEDSNDSLKGDLTDLPSQLLQPSLSTSPTLHSTPISTPSK